MFKRLATFRNLSSLDHIPRLERAQATGLVYFVTFPLTFYCGFYLSSFLAPFQFLSSHIINFLIGSIARMGVSETFLPL